MFFTRLAIAALSFGSVATVFAAPLGALPVVTPGAALALPGQRRLDVPLGATWESAVTTVQTIKDEVALIIAESNAVTPALTVAFGKIPTALTLLSTKLSDLEPAQDTMFTDVDGTEVSPETIFDELKTVVVTIDETVSMLKAFKSLELIQVQVADIKQRVVEMKSAFDTAFPDNVDALNVEVLFVTLAIAP